MDALFFSKKNRGAIWIFRGKGRSKVGQQWGVNCCRWAECPLPLKVFLMFFFSPLKTVASVEARKMNRFLIFLKGNHLHQTFVGWVRFRFLCFFKWGIGGADLTKRTKNVEIASNNTDWLSFVILYCYIVSHLLPTYVTYVFSLLWWLVVPTDMTPTEA